MARDRSRVIYSIVLFLFCILFCCRIFHIDQDLPPWGVVTYQPIDEGQYAQSAINKQTFGAINASDPTKTGLKYPVFTEYSLRSNILGNSLTILGLKYLGDNYYGLRVPYVIIGLINLLLFAATLRTLQQEHGSNKRDTWVLLAFVGFLLFDFCFYIASRTVEPTSVRLLVIQLCTFLYVKMKTSKRLRFLLLGCISVSSIFLIYITNTVLVLAMGFVLLAIWYREGFRAFIERTLWFLLGAVIGWGLGELYYRTVWDIGAIENTFTALNRFLAIAGMDSSYGAVGNGLSGILALVKHAFRFFCANNVLYNLPILCVYLLALPVLIWRCFDKKYADHYVLLCSLPLAFLIQTICFEDYIVRKFLILVPSILCTIYLLYLNQNIEFPPLPKWMRSQTAKTFWSCIVASFILLVAAYRLILISDGTAEDFSRYEKILVFAAGVLPSIIACGAWIFFDTDKDTIKRFILRWGLILGASTLLLNLGMIAKQVILNPTYKERDAMIQIANKVDHKYVFGGGFQLGYTLYNNMLPIVESPAVFCQYALETPGSFVLDYKEVDGYIRNQFDNIWFKNSDQSLRIVETLERNFSTNGRVFNMALYEVAPKAEIIAEYRSEYIAKRDAYLDLLTQYKNATNLSEEEADDYLRRIDEAKAEMEGTANIYPDLHTDIFEDVTQDIYTSIYGSVYGDIRANIYGDIYGDVFGDVYVKPTGRILGTVYGKTLYSE